jgi:hypothetical protein
MMPREITMSSDCRCFHLLPGMKKWLLNCHFTYCILITFLFPQINILFSFNKRCQNIIPPTPSSSDPELVLVTNTDFSVIMAPIWRLFCHHSKSQITVQETCQTRIVLFHIRCKES